MSYDKFPLSQIFDKGISLCFGQAPVQKYIDWVTTLKIKLNDIITHCLPLERALHAYELFKNKKEAVSRWLWPP